MYSWASVGVNVAKKGSGRFFLAWVAVALATAGLGQEKSTRRLLVCDSTLAALFTPSHPQLGRYEVCTTPEPLTAVARPGWKIEALAPLDAFGAAGSYDRTALTRLYGGRRAAVARGWIQQDGRFESLTLISPHPNATLTDLLPGTLIIRYVVSE
jgi:hypothetical protein